MTNEEYRKLLVSKGRKVIAKIEPFTFPKDEQGNHLAGWFIAQVENEGEEVYFVAPNVRGVGRLTNHTIEPSGEVNASVLIKGVGYEDDENGNPKDAEYHEFVVLDGWDDHYRKDSGKGSPTFIGI